MCATYVKHSLDANRQGHLGHLVQVIAKEPRICKNSLIGKCLDTSTRLEAGAWFVEGNVAIGTNAAKEQLDAADTADLVFVALAFGLEVSGISVEDVDVVWFHIDVGEEVLVHEAVIAFWMVARNANILVLIGSLLLRLGSRGGCCATLGVEVVPC